MPYADRERQLQAYRDRYQRRKSDPELLEKMQESRRRAARKIWSDPERREQINKRHRERMATAEGHAYTKKRLEARRAAVIEKYGGVCARCGFSDIRALCIDHVNGGGNTERRTGDRGPSFILRLVREPISPNYQILCANCNYIKAHENKEWASSRLSSTTSILG